MSIISPQYMQAREEYLKKIRIIEASDTGKDPDKLFGTDTDGGGHEVATVPVSSGNKSYVIPPIKVYPKEKIELPSEGRNEYLTVATQHAQQNILTSNIYTLIDTSKFNVPKDNAGKSPRFPGEQFLRYDLVFYLDELHSIVAKKLDVSKLTITSGFRTQEWSDTVVHKNKPESKRPKVGEHLSAIAVDLAASSMKEAKIIADAAYFIGFGCIAVGSGFVHLDIGPKIYRSYDSIPEYRDPSWKA